MAINRNIISIFEEIVHIHPEKVALRFRGESMSYSELNRRANQLARHLQKREIGAQDIIGIALDRSIDLIVGILGILKAGAIYLPIDPKYPRERKQIMVDDAVPKLIITSSQYEDQFDSAPLFLIDCEPLSSYADRDLKEVIDPADIAYINYTSGSTGRPKGVEVCHRGVVRLIKDAHWMPISPTDCFLQFSTISFDASTYEIWGALLNGATLCIYPHPELSIEELEKIKEEEGITHFECTPRVFHLIVDTHIDFFKGIDVVTVGGDVMSARHAQQLLRAVPTCQLLNTYGPTENTCLTTVYKIPNAEAIENGVPIGRPIDDTSVYILDEHLQPVPPGTPGELYTGGMGLARGYLNQPELTAKKFISNPFGPGRLYRTGDLVSYLPDGNIAFHGRIDDQVKVRGFRIEPGEIENCLRNHEAVADCMVLAREEDGEKVLVAYVQAKEGMTISSEQLKDHAESILPAHMIPSFFLVLDDFPLSPNGKVDRKALPSPKEHLNQRTIIEPEGETELILARIWSGILNLSHIGRTDDFFLLGGTSIDAVELAVLVGQAFDASIPVNWIFEHTTLEQYAKQLDQKETKTKEPFALWRDREAVLDPAIQPVFERLEKKAPKRIFLTGATGFVGAFFLYEFLENTDAQIFCLIRKNKAQLQKIMENYLIWKPEYDSRITAVIGDLEKPKLGIDPDEFERLAEEIETIYHVGALVNHALPYNKLKLANVLGTQEAIRLASNKRLKPFHYVSTVDVLEANEGKPVEEDIDIDTCKNLSTGYAQSKWVAEKLVLEARRRGLPANIYRLSRVSGHSEIGSGPTNDFLWRTVHACLHLKQAPKTNLKEEMTPVDFVCKAIHYISLQFDQLNRDFHILDNQLYAYSEILQLLQKTGYSLKIVQFENWRQKLVDQAMKTQEKALSALSTMFPVNDAESISFGNQRFMEVIKRAGFECPKLDENLFRKYVDYFAGIGFIPPYEHAINQ